MDGVINDDDESCCKLKKRWDIYKNYDDTYETNHEDDGRNELYEEYVAVKEDEYDDLAKTRPREGNIDKHWWRIYESGNIEVLES
ncbi:hypothetical protein Tco_0630576 [Tanacetum coccineum]